MMKKMLVLALVLAVAGLANAAIVDIYQQSGATYVSSPAEGTFAATLNAGQSLQLALRRTGAEAYLAGKYYLLVTEPSIGSISGGVPVVQTGTNSDGVIQISANNTLSPVEVYPGLANLVPTRNGVCYTYFNFDEWDPTKTNPVTEEPEAAEATVAGIHWKDIVLANNYTGVSTGVFKDTKVWVYTLTSGDTGPTGTWDLRDTIDVKMEVVPEPMTMGLLGLGALFLRKRK